jgi:dTDP-glucose pyrophosphorylase
MTLSKNEWRRTVLSSRASIEDAIHVLNDSGLRIVLIVDETGVLIGTVSDGDIRRGLLKGFGLGSPVKDVVHLNTLVVSSDVTREAVLQLMVENKIQQVPIVNESFQPMGLHHWDQISTIHPRENVMVIMAGGKGTRLHPHTQNYPKPLLPVAGKPILEHIINRAKLAGFSNFILAVYHLGDLIQEYFGDGEKLGVRIDYLKEASPLGTAGALSLLNPLPESTLIVTNGDVITDVHYDQLLDFHNEQKALATMAVRIYESQNPFGTVQTEGFEIVGYEEKPISLTQINAGVYAIEPKALELLEKGASCDMPVLFEKLRARDLKTIAYPIHESWIDVGRPEDLKRANEELN